MSKMEDLYCKLSSSIREIKACHWFCIPFLSHSLQKKAISSYAISLGPRKHNIWPSSYKARLLQHTELQKICLLLHTQRSVAKLPCLAPRIIYRTWQVNFPCKIAFELLPAHVPHNVSRVAFV